MGTFNLPTTPTHGYFVLYAVSLASRDQDGGPVGLNDRHLRSHGKIGDCEQSSRKQYLIRSTGPDLDNVSVSKAGWNNIQTERHLVLWCVYCTYPKPLHHILFHFTIRWCIKDQPSCQVSLVVPWNEILSLFSMFTFLFVSQHIL